MAADSHEMKLTAVGRIPCHWDAVRLRDVATEISVRAGDEYSNLPALSVTKHEGIVRADQYFGRDIQSRDKSNYKVISRGQFAYATIHLDEGSIGRLRVEEAGLVSPMYTVFEVNEQIDPAFLFYLLKSEHYIRRYQSLGQGTVNRRASISFAALGSMHIHYPPLPEQRAIATTLGAVEETIARTQVLIEQLRAAKYWQMRELLTLGHPRFRTTLQPITEPWPVGRVVPDITMKPQHWRLVTLTDVARLESGHTPSREHPEYWGGDIPWISLQDTDQLTDLVITETAEMVTAEGIANSSARILPKDTVVFSRTASVGLCSRMGAEMATSQDFANYICGPDILPAYLVQLFRSMSKEWDRLQEGSTHKTIYMPVFKRLQILLPSTDEQRAIADIGEAYDLRINAESDYLEQLSAAKRALAQGLLSGAITVTQITGV